MNKHINKKKTLRKVGLKKQINTVHPEGNRHTRRAKVANDRLDPFRNKKLKIASNIYKTKEAGRIAKQKKLDNRAKAKK